MSKPKDYSNMDVDSLLKEVSSIIEDLTKSEAAKAAALAKSEDDKSDDKDEKKDEEKDEKDKEDLEKDEEASGFESPAPEAAPAPASEAAPAAEAAPEQGSDEESLEAMITSLDDQSLMDLAAAVHAELESRHAQAPQEEAPAPAASAPEADLAPAPESPDMAALKSEVVELKDKLSKSEESSKKLEKAFIDLTSLVTKATTPKPVQKAVTDIRAVKFIEKGGEKMAKSEISDADLYKKATEVAGSNKALASLTKTERSHLQDYLVKRERNEQIEQILNK